MTTEKQQTPLQKLKTKLQTLLMAEGLRDAHLGIETSLKCLNDLLPEEKQMVIDAYNQGHIDGDSIAWCYKDQEGEQYFNETFGEIV